MQPSKTQTYNENLTEQKSHVEQEERKKKEDFDIQNENKAEPAVLDIKKAFDHVWHTCLLWKL